MCLVVDRVWLSNRYIRRVDAPHDGTLLVVFVVKKGWGWPIYQYPIIPESPNSFGTEKGDIIR